MFSEYKEILKILTVKVDDITNEICNIDEFEEKEVNFNFIERLSFCGILKNKMHHIRRIVSNNYEIYLYVKNDLNLSHYFNNSYYIGLFVYNKWQNSGENYIDLYNYESTLINRTKISNMTCDVKLFLSHLEIQLISNKTYIDSIISFEGIPDIARDMFKEIKRLKKIQNIKKVI